MSSFTSFYFKISHLPLYPFVRDKTWMRIEKYCKLEYVILTRDKPTLHGNIFRILNISEYTFATEINGV